MLQHNEGVRGASPTLDMPRFSTLITGLFLNKIKQDKRGDRYLHIHTVNVSQLIIIIKKGGAEFLQILCTII